MHRILWNKFLGIVLQGLSVPENMATTMQAPYKYQAEEQEHNRNNSNHDMYSLAKRPALK